MWIVKLRRDVSNPYWTGETYSPDQAEAHRFLLLNDARRVARELSKEYLARPLRLVPKKPKPIPMILHCPECRMRHLDRGDFAKKIHHTHACYGCGHVWRPAIVPTMGVQFLPGFKDEDGT